MTSDDIEKLLKDLGIIGKEILAVMPSEEAAVKREEDSKHEFVYWLCPKRCKDYQVKSLTKEGVTAMPCLCGTWMEWSYKPFEGTSTEHGG